MTLMYGYVGPAGPAPTLGSPWPGRELARVRRTIRLAATLPLALLLGVQWFFVVAEGLPETSGLPARAWWLGQLDALSVIAHPGRLAFLLAASAALTLLVCRGQAWSRIWLIVPAAFGSIVSLLVLFGRLGSGPTGGLLAVLVLLVWLASTWWAVGHALVAGRAPRRPTTIRTGLVLLLAWVALLPGPLALGRWLLAPGLRAEAAVLAGNTEGLRFAALLTPATVRLYLFGSVLAAFVWLAYQCWPRPVGRRSWRWYAALCLSFVALLELWWTAQSVADQRVSQLRYGSPGRELHFACARWVYPPAADAPAATPTQTVAVSGTDCDRVTVYDGFRQLGTTDAGVTVSPVAARAPAPPGSAADDASGPALGSGGVGPAGKPLDLVGARYGGVLVLAGSNRFDRTADRVVAVSVHGGAPLWQFVCGDKHEVRVRFAGGQLDPASDVTVPGEPGDVVVLTCGGRRLRLDPTTGLSAPR